MANRFSAGAFVVVLSWLLLAPFETQARPGGLGGSVGVGGFRGLPAARFRAAPPRFSGHRVAPRFSVGRPGFGKPGFGKPGFGKPGFGRHVVGPGALVHRVTGRRVHRFRNGYSYGWAYGAFPVDAVAVGGAVSYPAVTPYQGEPGEPSPGIGGPLVLRHVCQSEVQVVPATGGGQHEVTVTRCRLFAE